MNNLCNLQIDLFSQRVIAEIWLTFSFHKPKLFWKKRRTPLFISSVLQCQGTNYDYSSGKDYNILPRKNSLIWRRETPGRIAGQAVLRLRRVGRIIKAITHVGQVFLLSILASFTDWLGVSVPLKNGIFLALPIFVMSL